MGAEHNCKELNALGFTISDIPYGILSKHIFA